MEELLEKFRNNWLSLANENEVNVLRKFAVNGRSLTIFYFRKYMLSTKFNSKMFYFHEKNFLVLLLVPFTFYLSKPLIPKLLDVTHPLNKSRRSETSLKVDYLLDHDKHFWSIYSHSWLIFIALFISVASDCYFFMIAHNACGIFAVLRWA